MKNGSWQQWIPNLWDIWNILDLDRYNIAEPSIWWGLGGKNGSVWDEWIDRRINTEWFWKALKLHSATI